MNDERFAAAARCVPVLMEICWRRHVHRAEGVRLDVPSVYVVTIDDDGGRLEQRFAPGALGTPCSDGDQ